LARGPFDPAPTKQSLLSDQEQGVEHNSFREGNGQN
jgi:hypothetical protein